MSEFLTQYETPLRLGVFAFVLLSMMGLEALFPRKVRTQTRARRWSTNGLIILIDTLAVRLLVPILAVSVALYAQTQNLGVFNWLEWPAWLEIALAFVLLDMFIYWQHVAFHAVPPLWALHKVHHADRDIDVTTGVRFHPLEIVISMLYKFVCILILGPAAAAVILFEIVLNATAMFNHANLKLPLWMDAALRKLVVTPDMHRVHHSVAPSETHKNFGFNLSIWDRVFRTYKAQPDAGHDGVVIGLPDYQTDKPSHFLWSLALPFRR